MNSQIKEVDVILYSLTGLSSLQIGITGEVINEIISKKLDYRVVKCNNALLNCHFNQFHNVLACASCQSRVSFIHKKAGVTKDKIINLKRSKPTMDFPYFADYKEVTSYEYKGVNIGRGVASSLISQYRDYNLNSGNRKEFIELELEKAAIVVDNFFQILEEYLPKKFYIFNGRFSEVHPLIEICKQKNINFFTVESGSKLKYEYHENSLPHSIPKRTIKMHKLWDETDKEYRSKIGHDWYIKRRKGDDTYAKSFKQSGKANNRINELLDRNRKNVLILNSSEDEVKVIKEWENVLYDNQNEAIEKIVKYYEHNNDFNFVLRVHPNLKKVSNQQTEGIKNFNFPNLQVIKSTEEIDTYKMMDEFDVIIVFGSSTGIEATYWGKPSILFGHAFYDQLDVCHQPKTYDELFKMLETDKLKVFPQENCLKFSFYMGTRGIELKDFVPMGKSNSTFKGHKIPVANFGTFWNILKYLKSIPVWQKATKAAYQRGLRFKDLFRYKV